MKIKVLSEQAINQIAAGEVVENASSVVKELVENALDAGATEIDVQIKAGGRQLIRVADNGSGMGRDDALLSLERHATSKISNVDDLASVRTMGFRGEAVPSIAAVSKFRLLTSTGEVGTEISIEGGKILKVIDGARPRGTTIEVRSLFYNVPVRQQFQKSVAHDVGEVNRVMTLIALANPEVRFTFRNGEVEVFSTLADEGLPRRVGSLLGEEIAKGMERVAFEHEGSAVRGLVGQPHLSRPTRKGQYLFINGRPVVSRFVSDAVLAAYSTRLAPGRHPVFVLHLDLPGECVDVNVHPQKREVRLREGERIQRLLDKGVVEALRGEVTVTALPPPPPPMRLRERQEIYTIDLPEEEPEPEPRLVELPVQVMGLCEGYILIDQATVPQKIAAQLKLAGRGLLLVDGRAARARVLYERMKTQLASEQRSAQALLVPETIDLLPEEADLLSTRLEELGRIGIEIRPFGGRTFVVDALPPSMEPGDLPDLLAGLREEGDVAIAASRAAGRAPTHIAEAVALIRALWQCEVIDRCPRGRSVTTVLGLDQLKKRFL